MGSRTNIAWADATFNPWIGCARVSEACNNCYAAVWAARFKRHDAEHRDLWDPHAERQRTGRQTWSGPRQWNIAAAQAGRWQRVFCASLADVFDNRASAAWRADLWTLIRSTPALDWLLLTKRPQNIGNMLPPDWGDGWPNVWLGTTVENQTEARRRIPVLLNIPAAVRFLSCEPLLEPVDLMAWRIDWVICGGESLDGSPTLARPMRPEWARSLRAQTKAMGAAFFMKQTGSNRTLWPGVRHRKGERPGEWPSDLQIREWPQRRFHM